MNDTDITLASALASRDALINMLIDAMQDVRHLIAGYIDVRDTYYGEVPNDAMRADQLLEVVIAKARKARKVGAR